MGFSTELQDVFSHEALIKLQDAELRLLDNMKKCILLRAKCDKEYAASLSLVSTQAQKLEHFKELEGSCITRAWNAIIEETENLSKLIKKNAENSATVTIDALNNIISEKKALKKLYIEEHEALTKELHRLQTSVETTKVDYEKQLELWKDAKSKYEEQYIKGKGVKKVEDAKERYQKIAKRLHVLHNELVLLLCEASEYEKNFRSTLLPGLLYFQQTVMEDTSEMWKELLNEYCQFIDTTSDEFQAIQTRIKKIIEVIDSEDEYKEFIRQNRTEPLPPVEFKFDDNLLQDFTGALKANELIVDDFSHEFLTDRNHELELKLSKCEKALVKNQEDLNQYEDEIRFTHLVDFDSPKMKVKKRAVDIVVKELGRLKCVEHTLRVQLHLIKLAMSCVGEENLPQGLELDEVTNDQKVEFNTLFTRSSKLIMEKLKQPFHSLKHKHVVAGPPSPPSKDFLESVDTHDEEKFILKKQDVFDTSYQNEVWFHGVLPREEVVRFLVEDGDFLVRETTRNDIKQIVLSVCSHGYKHFIVHKTNDGLFRFEGPAFRTITELIDFQFESGMPITSKSGAMLKRAVARELWELNNDDVELIEKIGTGNFGDVYKAILHPYPKEVAVKICHWNLPEAQKRKFLQEGRILKDYDHPNIVKFIGICVQKLPFMIVMELISGGSLLNVLQSCKDDINVNQLLSFCINAAAGMEYLEGRSCIHRDLAARNCLVDDNNVVKISDFGMSRESKEYVVTDGQQHIPIKWTSPEALNYGVYTSLSDVWSFGILMWEIFSLGQVPYFGLSNNKAAEAVEGGYRLHAPDNTPGAVYQLMLQCWEYIPENRPHFNEIHSKLMEIADIVSEDISDL